MKHNNLNMNSFQEDDPNNFNPNSSPKEEMVSLSPIFTQYIYSYRNQTRNRINTSMFSWLS